MNARFETLIYTDCRPGQGLQGLAGLQFQACSSEAARAAEPAVQRHLLYEPPSRWMMDRRAVEDYPPSFGHLAADGLYATAAGVYLGKEANGSRQGNQLTHTIITDDPAAYGRFRPAQLFGADLWRSVPAETTTSDPVARTALATRFAPKSVRDFVLGQPHGAETLLALVSALEEAGAPGRPRVLFVGDDVEQIVRWLVAGTLLVPRSRALELGFKVFSTDPSRAGVPVVAVHRDFAGPSAQIDNQLGYAVFDLDEHTNTPVPATATAQRWVALFLGDDPGSAVDALDVAEASGLHRDETIASEAEREEAAAALGLAAILHRQPPVSYAVPIVGWLRTGPEQLRAAYAADIAAMFAENPLTWSHEVLLLLDAVGCDGLIPGKAASVRLALIRREVDLATQRAPKVVDARPPAMAEGEWEAADTAAAKDLVLDGIDRELSPMGFDALLRVAKRFGVDVTESDVAPVAPGFVAYWAQNPDAGFDPARWPCGQDLDRALIRELNARVELGGAEPATVGDGWRRRLLPRAGTLPGPLWGAVLGATVRHGDGDRLSFVDHYLSASAGDPKRFGSTAGALWSQGPPSTEELRRVLDLAPPDVGLPRIVFRGLVERITGDPGLRVADVELCRELIDRGLMPRDQKVTEVLADDRMLREATAELRADGTAGADTHAQLRRITRLPVRIVRAHASRVIEALLYVVAFKELGALLDQHEELSEAYCARLRRVLREEHEERHAAVGFYLAGGRFRNGHPLHERQMRALADWIVRAPDRRIEGAGQLLAPLGSAWEKAWRELVGQLAARRRTYRMTHIFRKG